MRLQSSEGLTEAGGFISKMLHMAGKLLLAVYQQVLVPLCMDIPKDILWSKQSKRAGCKLQ